MSRIYGRILSTTCFPLRVRSITNSLELRTVSTHLCTSSIFSLTSILHTVEVTDCWSEIYLLCILTIPVIVIPSGSTLVKSSGIDEIFEVSYF